MNNPLKKTNILIPSNEIDKTKWTVIACDQYTSDNDYWNNVKSIVGSSPSTLNLTLPEIYLNKNNIEELIKNINTTMNEYLTNNNLIEYKDTMFYIERKLSNNKIRQGIIGMIDLEEYDYNEKSTSLVRPTEKTIIERIPPRVKIRENATLELPHIMLLIDDLNKEIIEPLKDINKEQIYDFELMNNSGHLIGYKLDGSTCEDIITKLDKFKDKKYFNKKYNVKDKEVLLYAVGDGNHSLATAKRIYENLKEKVSKEVYLNHPSRYALVEIVNLHSDSLEFEPIHRVVFNVDEKDLLNELKKYYDINTTGGKQCFKIITASEDKTYYINNPKSNLAVGSIQIFLDEYLKDKNSEIDYIHEEENVRKLINDNTIGFIFDTIEKEELFKTVILDGSLPRKTFSMGESNDKRFYFEARKIK